MITIEDLLKEILQTEHAYWVVAQNNTKKEHSKMVRCKDSIFFISIPKNVGRGVNYENITLKQFEDLKRNYFDYNICFSPENYPPFQQCMNFSALYAGFPVTIDWEKINKFIVESIYIKSSSLASFKTLHDHLLQGETGELKIKEA